MPLNLDWTGTPDELVRMAHDIADPHVPERNADKEDCDYDHLVKVYEQVIEWDRGGRCQRKKSA